ncbi:MAG: hypothetical protein RCG15_00995 [Candidatus Rickettsia vulgarisii]
MNLVQFHELVINDYTYTEISIRFDRIEELEDVLSEILKLSKYQKKLFF